MHARLSYAQQRLAAAIDRFLQARSRHDKAIAARWVSAWALFNELHTREGLRRRMLQEAALRPYC